MDDLFIYVLSQPVAEQAVNIVLTQLEEPKDKKKQITSDQLLKNLPLVVEGIRLYSSVLAGSKITRKKTNPRTADDNSTLN